MRLFDTHCHLQDPAFEGEAGAVIARAQAAGVEEMALLGYDAPSNHRALAVAAAHPGVFPAVGFHPHEAGSVSEAMLVDLASLAALDEVVAVGEVGLDYFRDLAPRDAQRRLLDRQLALALDVGKPVCVHSRGAEDAIGEQLLPFAAEFTRRYPGRVACVMHCFGGTLEQATPYVEAGFMISVAAVVTYPKNEETRRLAAGVPLAQLVVETDSPYLPPQPMRGKRNEPIHVRAAAERIATVRGMEVQDLAFATVANARRLFGLTPDG